MPYSNIHTKFARNSRSHVLRTSDGSWKELHSYTITLSPPFTHFQPARSSSPTMSSSPFSDRTTESAESVIQRLPPELLERIIGSMPFENVAMTRLVCHRFNRTCQSILNQVRVSKFATYLTGPVSPVSIR